MHGDIARPAPAAKPAAPGAKAEPPRVTINGAFAGGREHRALGYNEAEHKGRIVEVKAFSDDYFALLKKHPGIGRYLAEAQSIIIVIEGKVYKIVKEM